MKRFDVVAIALLLPTLASAAELKPETLAAYEQHVTEVRQRFAAHVSGPFWIEQATDDARRGCAREP